MFFCFSLPKNVIYNKGKKLFSFEHFNNIQVNFLLCKNTKYTKVIFSGTILMDAMK